MLHQLEEVAMELSVVEKLTSINSFEYSHLQQTLWQLLFQLLGLSEKKDSGS